MCQVKVCSVFDLNSFFLTHDTEGCCSGYFDEWFEWIFLIVYLKKDDNGGAYKPSFQLDFDIRQVEKVETNSVLSHWVGDSFLDAFRSANADRVRAGEHARMTEHITLLIYTHIQHGFEDIASNDWFEDYKAN